MKKKKNDFYDDGRVIADMNVEGMPWYQKNRADCQPDAGGKNNPVSLSHKEKRALVRGVLGASFTVGIIYFGVFALFILFCIYVWFK